MPTAAMKKSSKRRCATASPLKRDLNTYLKGRATHARPFFHVRGEGAKNGAGRLAKDKPPGEALPYTMRAHRVLEVGDLSRCPGAFIEPRRIVLYSGTFFSTITLNTRKVTGQIATQIPNRSAWASCRTALNAGSLIPLRTGLISSISGPKYQIIHASGIEMIPSQNNT